jgi:predicted nuclease of predicted toxin-antitoxin system
MRILLDECVPWPMQRLLSAHSCTTVQAQGWAGIRNGELLQRAEANFDLFITSDQNIRYQQNLSGQAIAILELSTNDLHRIQVAAALIQGTIESMRPRDYKRLVIP